MFGLDKQAGTGSSSSYSLIVNHNMPFDAADSPIASFSQELFFHKELLRAQHIMIAVFVFYLRPVRAAGHSSKARVNGLRSSLDETPS